MVVSNKDHIKYGFYIMIIVINHVYWNVELSSSRRIISFILCFYGFYGPKRRTYSELLIIQKNGESLFKFGHSLTFNKDIIIYLSNFRLGVNDNS